MLKLLLLCIVMCGYALPLSAQTDSVVNAGPKIIFSAPVSVYTGLAKQFAADNLGNLYVLTDAGQLMKLNNRGDSLNVFNEVRRYGTVYAMDVTNPMKILLYYRNFSTIVMLDRYLNIVNTIDLRKHGIFQARAVGLAYDNNIWIFDEQSSKLKKIDENGKQITETVDLRQVADFTLLPVKIIDRDGLVYLVDATNGLLVFDYYGTLKNTIALTNLRDVQVISETIAGRRKENFVRYAPATLDFREALLPAAIRAAKQIYIAQGGIYVLNNKGIELYPFQ